MVVIPAGSFSGVCNTQRKLNYNSCVLWAMSLGVRTILKYSTQQGFFRSFLEIDLFVQYHVLYKNILIR